MTAIQKIKEKLAKYPDSQYRETDKSITVLPQDDSGFEVSLYERSDGYTVSFKGWHEEFADEVDALNCFAFGLFDEARIKVVIYGKRTYSWTLQAKEKDRWVDRETVTLLFYPFWMKKKIEYFQNHHHIPITK